MSRAEGGRVAVIPFPYYGGLQSFALELAWRTGTPVVALGRGRVPGEVGGVRIAWAGGGLTIFRAPIPLPGEAARLASHAGAYRLIHLHGPFPGGEDVVSTVSRCLLYTYHFDVEMVNPLARAAGLVYEVWLRRLLSRKACLVTASTMAFAESSRVLRPLLREGKVEILPLGVDASSLEPRPEYEDYVSFAGRIIPEKGVHVLIRALARLRERGVRLRAEIVGRPVDPDYYMALHRLAGRLGVHARFHGFLPRRRMLEIIGGSTVHVLPSTTRLESFGIVLLEAGSLARPLVATRAIPGAVELIARSRGGILSNPGDPDSLADAIEEAASDPKGYGSRARRYILEYHDWPRVVEKALEIYRVLEE